MDLILPGAANLTGPVYDSPKRPIVRVIPNARLPIALPAYGTLADTAASPSERQLTLAAANAPLRYTYGLDRIGPLIVNALLDSTGAMLLDCVIGEGAIGGVVATEINDAAPPAGVTVTVYDGSQAAADASLVSAWAVQGVVFADVRPGVAYAVIRIPATVDIEIDERSITFTLQGLKVHDPRAGAAGTSSLNYDFTKGLLPDQVAGLTPTVTRAGATATRINALGYIEIVPANTARFDYEPITLAINGLLVEEGRTNLLYYSNDQTVGAAWVMANITPTNVGEVAFGNALTTLTLGGGSVGHYFYEWIAGLPDNADVWVSIYVDMAGLTTKALYAQHIRKDANYVTGDLQWTGPRTINKSGGPYTLDFQVEIIGDYQAVLWMKFNCGAGATAPRFLFYIGDYGPYSGNGQFIKTSRVQAEFGSFRTSFIPTAATTITRNADQLTITNLAPFFNAAEGTIVAEFTVGLDFNSCGVFTFDDSVGDNLIELYTNNAVLNCRIKAAAVNQAVLVGPAVLANTTHRVALAYKANDFSASFDGAAVVTDSAGTVPAVSRLTLGNSWGGGYLNGHLVRFSYYPTRRTNAELVTLASGLQVTTDLRYSANPALCLADFLAHPTRGPGDSMNWPSVGVVADRCDTLLAAKKRHTFGLTFERQVKKSDIEETIRTGVCFVVREGPTTYLMIDGPVDVAGTVSFAAADWQPRELRYSQRDAANAPNRITVRYTNTAIKPWAEAYTEAIETADVTAGLVDAVESVINAPFIQDYAEAIRLRNRYYAEHTLGLKTLDFPVFEKGYKVRRGEVIRLTNDVDLIAKPVRVQRLVAIGAARVKITAQEYQPGLYSDDAPAAPTYPGTALPSPLTVQPVTGLTMVEEVYLDQLQTAGSGMASAATWLSRFRCTWTASVDRYFVDYIVRFLNGTQLVFEGRASTAEYVSPPVQQSLSYTVEVKARNTLGFLSTPPTTKSATALGKLLKPGPVPRISQALELGGEVLLAWDPAPDIDVIRYEWRYTPGSVSGSWESATLIDRVDGLRTRFKGLVTGTSRFYVKPIDSVPQYSITAAYADITITSDANAFLQALEFDSPVVLFVMLEYRLDGLRTPRWITDASSSWDDTFTAAMSTYTNPIITYGTGSSPSWTSETKDIGAVLTGTWTLTPNVVNYGSSPANNFQIWTSPDNSAWTPQTGLTYTGAARYVYIKELIGGYLGGAEIIDAPKITFSTITRKESGGPVTSSATVATTISLAGKYFKVVRITITPRGTVARMSTLNNIVLSLSGANSFDVYLFDQAGTQVASNFDWSFEGV